MADIAIGADGLFPAHECFDLMWHDPRRFPRLIMVGDEPAGFAIVHLTEDGVHDMEQFFVLRKFRRSGVGRAAAHAIFTAFPGRWEVEQIPANTVAQAFWRDVIAAFTQGDFVDHGGDDPYQAFTSG